MCSVSAVGDIYSRQLPQIHQFINGPGLTAPTRAEFEALKKDVEEMKRLLKRAKKYDDETGQPDCEMEDKVALLKKVAEMVGVDLSEIWGE